MTRRERELVDFIRAYLREHRISPSYEEMRAAMGLASKGGITRMLDQLEHQGVVFRLRHRTRSVQLVGDRPTRPASAGTVEAAERLLATIRFEAPERGVAIVDADALGDLDIALAENR